MYLGTELTQGFGKCEKKLKTRIGGGWQRRLLSTENPGF